MFKEKLSKALAQSGTSRFQIFIIILSFTVRNDAARVNITSRVGENRYYKDS